MAWWLLVVSAADNVVAGRPAHCPSRCGDVDIPYPFGIGAGCFRSGGFEIVCNTSNGKGDLVPTLGGARQAIQVRKLTVFPQPELKVMLPVAYQCYNSLGNITRVFSGDVELNKNGVYRISDQRNTLVVLGCNTVAWTQNGDSEGKGYYRNLYYAGCVTYCRDSLSAKDDECASVGCCHVDIPPELTDNGVYFEQNWPRGDQVDFSPCDYAFLVAKDKYRFRRSDLKMKLNQRMPGSKPNLEGLRYMHSSVSNTIRHGDVKPANILLTDKFIAKISDFGTSKLLTVDKEFTVVVTGSMGYIDPVFYLTGHLTQKSDVYSFGVVLLELISRRPTIYGKDCSLIIEFQEAYDQVNSGRALFDKEIIVEEDVLILEEIGRLAMECLKDKIEERPDMKEIVARLVMLRRSRKLTQENYNISPEQYFEENSIDELPKCCGDDSTTSSAASAYNTIQSSRKELSNP
uniref:Protein kinase domain-containing protein n=1 Tax=Oryza rufipogon TaxID=4529 RepID=A0A0E0QVL7_ORYRU